MQKILLVGPEEKKRAVLERLQELGLLEVRPYKGTQFQRQSGEADSAESERVLSAYRFINSFVDCCTDSGITPHKHQLYNFNSAVSEIHDLESRYTQLKDKILSVDNNLREISVWGRFSIDALRDIEKAARCSIQFWEVPSKIFSGCNFSAAHEFLEVTSTPLIHYCLTFANSRIHLEGCLEISVVNDMYQLEEMKRSLSTELDDVLAHILGYVEYRNDIFRLYLASLDKLNLEKAQRSSVSPLESVFALQGWIVSANRERLFYEMTNSGVAAYDIAPDEGESVPTAIRNKRFAAVGQELVEFYDTPSHKDWDPSSFVFLSFIVFFAMIMGDGGYGLTLLAVTFLAFLKIKKPGPKAKRLLAMSAIISVATLIYGISSGSFFGITEGNRALGWILGFKLFSTGSDKESLSMMMRVSVLVGMVHISLSLLLKGLRQIFQFSDRQSIIQSVSNFTWIVIIWTFFFWYGNSFMGVPSNTHEEKIILISSAAVVFLTSSGSFNPLKIFTGGLLGLYNGVQFFADVLSYLRIFALGLSSALIAQTFNSIAGSIADMGGFFIVLSILIAVLGHLLNLGLSIMSSVIHGLRLNYLEYYRWSFDGGGKAFSPLKRLLEQ